MKSGIELRNVITDSWFTNTDLVQFIHNRRQEVGFSEMAKMGNTLYRWGKDEMNARAIVKNITSNKKEKLIKRSSKLKMKYCGVDVALGEVNVRLLFFKNMDNGDWDALPLKGIGSGYGT